LQDGGQLVGQFFGVAQDAGRDSHAVIPAVDGQDGTVAVVDDPTLGLIGHGQFRDQVFLEHFALCNLEGEQAADDDEHDHANAGSYHYQASILTIIH